MARAVFGRGTHTSNTVNPGASPSGTMGGIPHAAGRRPGMKLAVGDEGYLWILIALELALMGYLRQHFRRYHGG